MNRRELAFCTAYAVCRSVPQAAREAGYSNAYASSRAYLLLERPHIRETIASFGREMVEHVALGAAQVVNQLGAIGMTQHLDLLRLEDDGRYVYKSPDQLTSMQRAAVRTIQITDVTLASGEVVQEYSYQLHDKMSALNQLGQHFEIFGDTKAVDRKANPFATMSQEQLDRIEAALNVTMINAPQETVDGEVLPAD